MFLGFWGITQCKVIPAEVWGDTTPPYLCVKVLLTLRMESLLSSETAVIISLRCVTCQKTNIDRQQCKMLNEGILRDCGIHTTIHTHTHIFRYLINIIQCVPLAIEPGFSLIILTPMKILQRNLNRSTFVVWEMKRNVTAVRSKFRCNILISCKIIKEMPGSVASGTHCIHLT